MDHALRFFLDFMQKLLPFHFKLHLLYTNDFFFPQHHEWFMTFWRRIPQDYIRNREKQAIEPNLKKKKSTFSKSRFHLGFSQITVFYSPKVLLHSKVHPISARIPLFPFLCCQHTTINLMFGPQWCPGMSSCPDTSPFPPVNFAVGLHKWPH